MGVSFVNFVKLKKIGKGGQGTVFRGTNSDGLQFALKKVDDRADAQREVEALKRVGEHPNVVRVHGTEIVDDTAYVLMDLLQGESLGDYRGSFRWTTNTWWTTVLLPLLRGVSHIHAAGLVHRDLKPDNIIMVPDHQGSRRPVVVDLGLAKRTHSSRTHLIGKTPKYFSPEWSDIQLIKPAYDIFLLALITYEVLHGDEYYDADDDQWELDRMRAELEEDGSSFSKAIANALDDDPDHRPQTCFDWVASMLEFESDFDPLQSFSEQSSTVHGSGYSYSKEAEESRSSRSLQTVSRSVTETPHTTGAMSIALFCKEIEQDFGLPDSSIAILGRDGKVTNGKMLLRNYRDAVAIKWATDSDNLARLAENVKQRYGVEVGFLNPASGPKQDRVANKNTKLSTFKERFS